MSFLTKEVASRLRAARKAAGYKSARVFTDKFNLASSTYCQHETGQRSLTLERLIQYSECLGVKSTWLLTGQGPAYDHSKDSKEKELGLTLELVEVDPAQHSNTLQIIDKTVCTVDMKLFYKILLKALDTIAQCQQSISYEDVIDFCFDIYNTLITTAKDESTRDAIMHLAINSMLKGYSVSTANKKYQNIS